MLNFTWHLDGLAVDLVFDHQPEEPDTWDNPGCEEDFQLESATVNGVDITALFDEQPELIEKAIRDLKAERADYPPPRSRSRAVSWFQHPEAA
jgi:hypothetical protein